MDFKTQMGMHHNKAKAILEKHTKERESFKRKVKTALQHPGEGAHKNMVNQAHRRANQDAMSGSFQQMMAKARPGECAGKYSQALRITTCKILEEKGLEFLVTKGECKPRSPKKSKGVNACYKMDPKSKTRVGPSLAQVNSIELIRPRGTLSTTQMGTKEYMKKLFQMYVTQTETNKMAKTTKQLTLCFNKGTSPLCPSGNEKEEDELSEQEEAQRLGEIAGVGRRGGFNPSSGAGSFFIGASNRAGNSEALELLGEGRRGSSAFTNVADFSLAGSSNRAGNSEM